MPVGDTIFRAARTLQRALGGQIVTGFDTAYAPLARVHDDTPITGRTVEAVESYGKHLVMRFSGDLALRTHMRMHGSWHLYRPGERWQRPRSAMRIVIETAPFVAVGFDIPDAAFVKASALGARDDALSRLGPDLLRPDFDAGAARSRLRARGDQPIAEALLEQRVMAGIGNVFKSEILFEGGVHPRTPVSRLTDEQLAQLIAIAQRQLAMNVREAPRARGGTRRTTGRLAPGDGLWVYNRRGEPCRRCGTAIASEKQGFGARSTYWCPRCQPEPARG
jgi:endonuclease-8